MAKARLTKEQRIKKAKRFRRKLTGLIFLLLAMIGVAAIVVVIVNRVNVALDDTDEKLEYEQLFSALVSLDPAEFNSIENADMDKLKEAAIFTTLEFENTEKYEMDEFGRIILPVVDIERYATRLFGSRVSLVHGTFGQDGTKDPNTGVDNTGYIYLPEQEAYAIPPASTAGSYIPVVESIQRSGNTKTLLIAYAQVDTSGTGMYNPDTMSIAKYREYVLIKEGSDFHLYSIRVPEATISQSDTQ